MKNITKQKRQKLTTGTYMKEAVDYRTLIIKSDNDYYITIKKYDRVNSPISFDGITYIDNNYYLVEITPIKDFCNIRFYVTKDYQTVSYYIDISLENGLYQKVPYYTDLYLDIVYYPKDNTVKFSDEDELLEAFKTGLISKRDYNFAYKVGNKIMEEIKQCRNKYINLDVIEIIKQSGL